LRFVFDEKIFNATNLDLVTYGQELIETITPNPGWVEQDPDEILNKTILCIEKAIKQLEESGYHKSDIQGIIINDVLIEYFI
jgi:glycerol kinase